MGILTTLNSGTRVANNQVSIITSTAERKAAVEFAKAAAIRPQLVGESLQKISQDPETANAMFTVLEIQKLLRGSARLTLVPSTPSGNLLTSILAAKETPATAREAPPKS